MTLDRPVILYDAGCNLCLGSVGFVRRRGGATRFQFVPLGSPEATGLLTEGSGGCDTLHLVDERGHHERSTAVLRIAAQLERPWSWLRFFLFVPSGLRDALYDFIARRRIRWFGRAEENSCPNK
jgi:predicted DCC family thiol-disulfide oxidoreductase YuxK